MSVAKVWHNSLKESPGSALMSSLAKIATKYNYVWGSWQLIGPITDG